MNKPTYDFFETPPQSNFDIEEIIDHFIFALETGYFAIWEAIVCQEENKELTVYQKKHLNQLIGFRKYENGPILYINEQARPNKKWHEIANEIATKMVSGRVITYEDDDRLAFGTWSKFKDAIKKYGKKLSKPEGVKKPIKVIQKNIWHRLEIETALDELTCLGMDEESSLNNPDELHRIDDIIGNLYDIISSVKYFKLSLEKIANVFVKLKEEDRILFEEILIKKLGLEDRKADMTEKLKIYYS